MESFDNVTNLVGEDLRNGIVRGDKVSVAAACFSIYAFEELKEQLKDIESFKFFFTVPTSGDLSNGVLCKKLAEVILGNKLENKFKNNMMQKAVAKECAQWLQAKARFKANVTNNDKLPSVLNVESMLSGSGFSYKGVDEFTADGLGFAQNNNPFIDISKYESFETDKYLTMFEQLWNREEFSADVTDVVLNYLEQAYKDNSPEYIYFVALYSICYDYFASKGEKTESASADVDTALKHSVIWNKLFTFQKHAVIDIIEKLNKHNGCILADSVGLGKTFTALAVIKYFELTKQKVLVLCPKKLADNWKAYNKYASKDNILVEDDLHYIVMHHTDLNREGKSTGDFEDLNKIDWGSFDLVVIDESHNFRTGSKNVKIPSPDEFPEGDIIGYKHDNYTDEDVPILTEDAKKRFHHQYWNRYDFLLNEVIKEGRRTKVLMLSATPLNNEFKDLRNQIMLAYEGDYSTDYGNKLEKITRLSALLRNAQETFNDWSKLEPEQRTAKLLLENLGNEFKKLLTDVTIARSRKDIVEGYGTGEIGTFPKHLAPDNRYTPLSSKDGLLTFAKLYDQVISLNLAIYSPSLFVLPSTVEEIKSFDKQMKALKEGREIGVKKMMSINFLKRIESCIYSFSKTTIRLRDKLNVVLQKIAEYEANNATKAPVIAIDADLDNDMDEDMDIGMIEDILKNKVDLKKIDYLKWKDFLQHDRDALNEIIDEMGNPSAATDLKLQELKKIIADKIANPFNAGNKKVLIFTAFADTAEYLYENLKDEMLKQGLHTAVVTGNQVATTLPLKKVEFNKVLTLFAPKAKNKQQYYSDIKEDIDILIGTDCISEGQNLQDCDVVINYDIHWNPVRIIQRFGRVDRIGSTNDTIQMINFWPQIELNEYLKLQSRVENRMTALTAVSNPGDNPLNPEQLKDANYRTKQMEDMKRKNIDLDDANGGASITSFIQKKEKYKFELRDYMGKHPDLSQAPLGLETVVHSEMDMPQGAIFVLRNVKKQQKPDQYNPCYPCYLVYVQDNGEIYCKYSDAYMTLKFLNSCCRDKKEPDEGLCREYNAETNNGKDMKHYQELLAKAIASINETDRENDKVVFIEGNPDAFAEQGTKGLGDFELICYFVVK